MIEVKLHDIGEGMNEAEVISLLVKQGDYVKADDPLIEVQTDKMTAEIPAPKNGIIKEIKVTEGDTIPVGSILLTMEEGDKQVEITKPKRKFIIAAPHTRRIAREHQVNIEEVEGTGPAGRITDLDIFRYVEMRKVKTDAITPTIEIEPQVINIISSNEATENQRQIETNFSSSETKNIVPFRGRRKEIAKRLSKSMYTIPHCTHFEEVDVTNLLTFLDELNAQGRKVSATAIFIKALSLTLKEFPIFNAELDEEKEEIHIKEAHHIGIATDTKDGLIVPVIRHCEKKSIMMIHDEMKQLTKKAINNQLTVKDISGGTFTISNVGPLGGSIGATPIIQHPEVAILSFHKMKKMPVVLEDDQIAIRKVMNISMSFDHRVTDGANAVAFTNRFSEYIKHPYRMLIEMI